MRKSAFACLIEMIIEKMIECKAKFVLAFVRFSVKIMLCHLTNVYSLVEKI